MALLATGKATVAYAGDAPPVETSPFRYDDDVAAYADREDIYGQLKYIRVGAGYVSFGADLRERAELSHNIGLGARGRTSDAYLLHRLLAFGDLHLNNVVRVFVQVGNHLETGRRAAAAPTDIDRFDLTQGFVDLAHPLAGGQLTLRVGRAEMSFDDGILIGLRDGPNVRQVWDGVRVSYAKPRLRLDAFAVRPVAVSPGAFDDGAATGAALQGVHASLTFSKTTGADVFWYRSIKPSVAILRTNGRARTNTLGVRLHRASQTLDGTMTLIVQTGQVGSRPVRAFAGHIDVGGYLGHRTWMPHLGLRADVLSGGDPNGRTVNTFDALYPNVSYSTEAAIEAPANLIEVGLVGKVSPARTIDVQYTFERLWRYSSRDAYYAAPLMPLVGPNASGRRALGLLQQLALTWRANPFVTVRAAAVRFDHGRWLSEQGARNETFGTLIFSVRL
ncbi:alginate export family protein [Novosphingobium sp.]|uniref:alginate export family protein n=1 Tax=Novosphingobium sp. TaxID=1874826 RepID=UPI003BAA3BC6